ncbi:MAG: hypothetical protein J5732_00865 [Bacteroidaceae bacterium]|nr:hypothetical protein [Bacteroidaceae bacterium]
MDKKDAIKILKQQREYWGFEISDSEKSPHPVLRKDLCAALDVAIEELQKE